MTQVHGNAAPNAATPGDRTSLGRLIGAGLLLAGLVLLALGAYLGPYTYATATPGKLTVDTCTVDYKYRSSTSSGSRKKTKTRWCYGTFTSADGSVKDLNAELKSDALHQRGYVIEAVKTGDTSYKLDHGWAGAIAVGCAWFFGALISLAIGTFGTVTGFTSGGTSAQGLFRTCLVLVGVGVVGLVVSLLVVFFV
ncbi:hypothetical protein ACM01_30715 [Streptomyces viridochromogenes]|uniref:Uncharacterized protein n=1 Tax=Streptomyces viridochromogenes TaxID=1938 RepID=A0A0J8BYV0_STRVR|nr:hypothetical protein [Streptomyces viridochromogenes]KMS70650.1 hypothetical protein ACM01_30715 [Streptomyces viridochromogenes]KOG16771.1 hypothetical protein ADK36_26475 [Streptomyces viridochromogenes]KOG17955.1 hypothetical protein ADK35_23330 [Streptomyces viridochromogenes]